MLPTEPQAVREIHEIRERLYREQQGWTDQQLLDYYRAIRERWARELQLQVKPSSSRSPQKKTA